MRILIDINTLNNYKSRDNIPCECKHCGKTFLITKNLAQRVIKGAKKADFCSRKCCCSYKSGETTVELSCSNCQKYFRRSRCDCSQNNNFCSKQCANSFSGEQRKLNFKPINCSHCGIQVTRDSKFCSRKCNTEFKYQENIKLWKTGVKTGYSGKTLVICNFVRRFLLQKYNNQCCKCGWKEIHSVTGKVPVEVNHIDGDASNCKEDNLEIVCPNHHSLTSNFRALNRNSKRQR